MTNVALSQLKLKAQSFVNTVRNSRSVISKKRLNENEIEDLLPFELKSKKSPSKEPKSGSGTKRRRLEHTNDFEPPVGVYGVLESTAKEVQTAPIFKQPRKVFKKMREARENEADRTLFIGNLSLSVKESDLLKLCSQYGKISSIRFRNFFAAADSKVSKGVAASRGKLNEAVNHCVAFVVFDEISCAKDAVSHLKGLKLANRHLNVSLASDRESFVSKLSVFVGNLTRQADEEEVRLYFRNFGSIMSVRLVRDRQSGECKGFGFVQFANYEAVMLCLRQNKHRLYNRTLTVTRCQKNEKRSSAMPKEINENPYKAEMRSKKKEAKKGKKEKKPKKNKSITSTTAAEKVKKTKYVKDKSRTGDLTDSKKAKRKKRRPTSLI